MWYKYIFWSILVVIAALAQVSFSSSQNLILSNFNFLLAVLVLLVNLARFDKVIFFLIIGGTILDIYSSVPFGFFLLSYLLVAVILEILFKNFFTNRSFYSLIILGVIAVLFFNGIFLLLSGIAYSLGWSEYFTNWSYLAAAGWQLADSLVFLTAAFFLINYLSKKFKPVFLHS